MNHHVMAGRKGKFMGRGEGRNGREGEGRKEDERQQLQDGGFAGGLVFRDTGHVNGKQNG